MVGAKQRSMALGCCLILGCTMGLGGCDEAPEASPEGQEEATEGVNLQLVVPSFEEAPAVRLTFQLVSVKESESQGMAEPVGNILYLAARDCEEAHPDEGEEVSRVAAVNYFIEDGKVVAPEEAEPDWEQARGEPVSDEGYRCVVEAMEGETVDLPASWPGGDLEVNGQVELYW